MNQSELINLKCRDIIQCRNHPKAKGIAVEMLECETIEERDTVCGCKAKDYDIVKRNEDS